jgi:hypothetical protein
VYLQVVRHPRQKKMTKKNYKYIFTIQGRQTVSAHANFLIKIIRACTKVGMKNYFFFFKIDFSQLIFLRTKTQHHQKVFWSSEVKDFNNLTLLLFLIVV